MGRTVYPTDEDGVPICARPADDGLPCLEPVLVPGTPCHDHRGLSPIEAERVVWSRPDPQWSL